LDKPESDVDICRPHVIHLKLNTLNCKIAELANGMKKKTTEYEYFKTKKELDKHMDKRVRSVITEKKVFGSQGLTSFIYQCGASRTSYSIL
jgi:GH24 family phage-related lysozyme (muramidase)